MTKEEFKKQLLVVENEYEKRKHDLCLQFAKELPIKAGDIVTDHIGDARVVRIKSVGFCFGDCEVIYLCQNLTKSGDVSKREPTRNVYYCNIKCIEHKS